MRTSDYPLREDERTRFEKEIVLPMLVIFCVAASVLYATSSAIPGQFAGRPGFHIQPWVAGLALFALLSVWALRWQRPTSYRITDDGIEIILPVTTYVINFDEILEVVSIADRRAQSLAKAIILGTGQRAIAGFSNLARRAAGGSALSKVNANAYYNCTTSDTGGAKILCKNGAEVLVSPMDLSGFLRHCEAEFSARKLTARVVREVAVKITSK